MEEYVELFPEEEEEVQEEVSPLQVEKPKEEEQLWIPGQVRRIREILRGLGGCRRAPR